MSSNLQALRKKLISNVANTKKLPMTMMRTNATNCYDRVAHLFASTCTQCFRLELESLVIFRAI